MPEPQNFKNHGRLDPPYHFFIAIVLLANVIITIVQSFHLWHHRPFMAVWHVVVALALFLLVIGIRKPACPLNYSETPGPTVPTDWRRR